MDSASNKTSKNRLSITMNVQRLIPLEVNMRTLCNKPVPSAKMWLASAMVLVRVIMLNLQKNADRILCHLAESVPSITSAAHCRVNSERKSNP